MATVNIEHFQRKLAEGMDEDQRQVLLGLLAEEQAKLALAKELKAPKDGDHDIDASGDDLL